MGQWCILEYIHIAEIVGASNMIVTKISDSDAKHLPSGVEFNNKSIMELKFPKICLLELRAKDELVTADKEIFDYLLFGGILGDHPPLDRTSHLRTISLQGRHLGREQMSTDGAVNVCQRILNGAKLASIPFCDFPLEFKKDERESVELPFKYIKKDDGSADMPTGLLNHLLADFSLVGSKEGESGDLDWVINSDDVLDTDYKLV